MDKNKAAKILQQLSKSIPCPRTELHYNSPFELLIAVLLSAHTTDKSVNEATLQLFKVANTPATILHLGENKLKNYIKRVGLYNNKAVNIIKTCEILVNEYQAQIPNTREKLMQLPGVGRKTANVILNIIFGQPTIAVDTHIFRIANRTKLAEGKTALAVEEKLLKIVPAKFLATAHHLLLLHARYVCKARTPLCHKCVINEWCDYLDKC